MWVFLATFTSPTIGPPECHLFLIIWFALWHVMTIAEILLTWCLITINQSFMGDKICSWLVAGIGRFLWEHLFPPIKLTTIIQLKYCWNWRKTPKTINLQKYLCIYRQAAKLLNIKKRGETNTKTYKQINKRIKKKNTPSFPRKVKIS